MRSSFLFVILFVLSLSMVGQNSENKLNSNGKKQGYWKKYDDKGVLLYEGTFDNDVPVGTFKYYHKNGKLKSITTFQQGVHKVHTVMYDENENKSAEGNFINQEKDSIWNYYNPKGQLINVESYKKGKKEGIWRVYSSQTGILLEEKKYSDDRLNGTYRSFFADGNLQNRIDYINGEMNGIVESYYPENKIYIRGTYHNGLKVKKWDYYDEDGKIRKTVEYNNSRIIATYLYLNGQKMNQSMIAYFHKEGEQTRVVSFNGKSILFNESFDKATAFLDYVDFCRINPSYVASYGAIIKYQEIDEDTVEVMLAPNTAEPVLCEGDQAKEVKMMFNKTLPKE